MITSAETPETEDGFDSLEISTLTNFIANEIQEAQKHTKRINDTKKGQRYDRCKNCILYALLIYAVLGVTYTLIILHQLQNENVSKCICFSQSDNAVNSINSTKIFPTSFPTNIPSFNPSNAPTLQPSNNPTFIPTMNPSQNPSHFPTLYPSNIPTFIPTMNPSKIPTKYPSEIPSFSPTKTAPTLEPTYNPTTNPVDKHHKFSNIFLFGDFKLSYLSRSHSHWLICNGDSYSTATYSELFSVIGYTYGGSGVSFNVPDLRGYTLGAVGPSHVMNSEIGTETGNISISLGEEHMPEHTHLVYYNGECGNGQLNDALSGQCTQRSTEDKYVLGTRSGVSANMGMSSSVGESETYDFVYDKWQPTKFAMNVFIYAGVDLKDVGSD